MHNKDMHAIELELNGTTLRGPVGGPWEISSDRYRLTLAATPRGPAIVGWQAVGGPELVGAPHPFCDLIPGGEVKTPAAAETTIIGGRQALSLLLSTATETLTLRQRLIVFPGSPVIQLATTVENTGAAPLALGRVDCGGISLAAGGQAPLLRWIIAPDNNSKDLPGPARCVEAPIAGGETRVIDGRKSNDYVPWFCCQSGEGPRPGVALWLDYLGSWQLGACRPLSGSGYDNNRGAQVHLMARANISRTLAPGESLCLPVITFCPFTGGLDAMMETIYDWQYAWQWDLVGQRYFARSLLTTPWYMDVHNLQENWAGRLADLDLTTAERARSLGFGMLWDDAGWSEGINIWGPTREGPDFRLTRRYLAKMDLTWLLWFCGQPAEGILNAKRAAWGDFQWRTDGQGDFDHRRDAEFRAQISSWRERYRHGSFHSCDGGSRYAHTFGIQRLGDTHMLADPGLREVSNWYLSYFEVPDKWHDLMPSWYTRGFVDPCSANQVLAMTPAWDTDPGVEGHDRLRQIALLYRYFLAVGLAGRWSYQHHPAVEKGDAEWNYVQRTSHDRRRACLILKQQPRGVFVRPTGLLDDHFYEIGYLSRPDTTPFMTDWGQEPKSLAPRSGRDLMQNGIFFSMQSTWPGEIVFLGCVDRPGSGRPRPAPQAPGRVLVRRETNISHAGVGLYWSPAADPHGTHRYEVRRDGVVIGTAAQGCHFFDHAPGADTTAQYAVRTVDIDNRTSGWTAATRLPDEPFVAWALGGHFPEAGRDGWSAEHLEATGWQPMAWVPRPFSAAGDHGGTGRQPGGVEGWWEAVDGARIGRGWQQAGSSGACARLWTVPASGQYRIVGRPVKERYRQERGGSLRVRILVNNRQAWPGTGWSEVETRKDTQGQPHDLRLDLKAGDVVRFVLDQGTNPADDVVAWMPAIYALPTEAATTAPESVVRIACGRATALTGADGNRWDADHLGQGGTPYTSVNAIEGAINPALLQAGCVGATIRYAIPLPPGLYAVRLHWAETLCRQLGDRVFNVDINGRRILRDFDVLQAAQGADRAWDEVFRYQVPDADGLMVVELLGSSHPLSTTTEAFLSAIEVLPESGVQRRVTCGTDRDWIDWSGQVWTADGRTKSDEVLHTTRVVEQANPTLLDQGLYQTARTRQDFAVRLPLPPGLYSVHLLIAELWQEQPGQRPMDIWINDQTLVTGWDPATHAARGGVNSYISTTDAQGTGSAPATHAAAVSRAADLRLDSVAPAADGCITVRCRACGECPAILQAIAID